MLKQIPSGRKKNIVVSYKKFYPKAIMISYLKGTVQENNNGKLNIILSSGIGFTIQAINCEQFKKDDEVALHIFFNWHQENGPTLFGFLKEEEKAIFELIIECQGIGPKMAASILNQMKPEIFINAIIEHDPKTLSSLNGIGPKKAEQIVFQLKDKISKLKESVIVRTSPIAKHFSTITEVLGSLSYSKQEISSTIDYLGTTCKEDTIAFDELLRKSLSFLSKRA